MKNALISVSDKTNLNLIAKALVDNDFQILTTSGTKKYLDEHRIPSILLENYTGLQEMLDGRVKTLHPKIHGGLLADRDKQSHLDDLKNNQIDCIDVVIVNLYPFQKNLSSGKTFAEMVELIDIGGPSMLRSAAKNFKHVLSLVDPADYSTVIEYVSQKKDIPYEIRASFARKVFTFTSQYDLDIARYFSSEGNWSIDNINPIEGVVLEKIQDLRYGENPHQKASFYKKAFSTEKTWSQLQGKELSYNNLLDLDASLQVINPFFNNELYNSEATAVIIKHLNPCGVASDKTLLSALKKAKQCDPRSHFGGILAFNKTVDVEVAQEIKDDFCEIVVAPSYTEEAKQLLKSSKNLRVIELSGDKPFNRKQDIRYVEGGVLIQELDLEVSKIEDAKIVSKAQPTKEQLTDLQFAWNICAQVKSNAIVVVKDNKLIGVGGGQMSRIDSVELAISKAKTHGHDLNGAVVASDAFFPFPDSVETLASVGIKAIVVPSGAKRDTESIEMADKNGVSLLFVGDRHFKH